MKSLSPWIEACVGGVSGLAVVLVHELLKGRLPTFTSSDAATFAGALIGVAGAIFGGMFLEDRKRRRDHLEEMALLIGAIEEIRDGASAFVGQIPEGYSKQELQDILVAGLSRVEIGREKLDFAVERSLVAVRSLKLFDALHRLQRALNADAELVQSESRLIRSERSTQTIIEIGREKLANHMSAVHMTSVIAIDAAKSK